MKTTKLSHIVFGLTMIVALMLATIPTAPAYAMSDTAAPQSNSVAADDNGSSTLTAGAVVCRSWTVWRDGHRVTIRVCHRVHDKDKDRDK